MSTGFKVALGLIGFLILIALLWFAMMFIQRGTADFRGETDVIEQTEADAQFRMQAYDKFYDQCAAVQTAEARIDALEEELESASGVRADELKTTLTANKAQRAGLINQYNADASKDWTVGQFKANDLPPKLFVEQENTTCAL